MKCGIVKASDAAKYKRLDAEFYLGNHDVIEGSIVAQKQKQVAEAQARLDVEEMRQEAEVARVDGFVKRGTVRPIE